MVTPEATGATLSAAPDRGFPGRRGTDHVAVSLPPGSISATYGAAAAGRRAGRAREEGSRPAATPRAPVGGVRVRPRPAPSEPPSAARACPRNVPPYAGHVESPGWHGFWHEAAQAVPPQPGQERQRKVAVRGRSCCSANATQSASVEHAAQRTSASEQRL